tara:strand:- start:1091 stop:1789 length:699 start_codon:yes stop_codon:yes gene_type:complete
MISKPKRSDFPTGRQGSESYNAALKKYRDAVKRQKSKDPRPTYSDSKYPNYEAFRKDVKAWKERNQKPKKQKQRLSPYERKHGKKQPGVGNNNLKINKGKPFAKDRVGKVDLESSEYKEAKRINERVSKKEVKKTKDGKKKNNNNTPSLEKSVEYLNKDKKQKPEVTYKDFESDNKDNGKKTEDKKTKPKPKPKFIRNPKTKTLVRTTSQKGKQLLKIQERIKKRNKRLFGK